MAAQAQEHADAERVAKLTAMLVVLDGYEDELKEMKAALQAMRAENEATS